MIKEIYGSLHDLFEIKGHILLYIDIKKIIIRNIVCIGERSWVLLSVWVCTA